MTRPLIYIPIEPITERYTEQWYRCLPPQFKAAGFDVTVVDGTPLLNNEIKVGTFLDINSTTHYKWSQLMQISRLFETGQIADGSVFFFGDIEFWGLEAVRLLADMNGVKVKLTGFLHAASYTFEDAFEVAAPYQQYTEVGWIAALDEVYVGSEYHKHAVVSRRLDPVGAGHLADRIHVTGNPLFMDEYHTFDYGSKQNLIVLTNRFDQEKRPGDTLDVFEAVKSRVPEWNFAICTSRPTLRSNDPSLEARARYLQNRGVLTIYEGLSKESYHFMLHQARVMVSHSIEEMYGYCIAEALVYGCAPFLLAGASHNEMVEYNPSLLFPRHSSVKEQAARLIDLMETTISNQTDVVSGCKAKAARKAKALTLLTNRLVSL